MASPSTAPKENLTQTIKYNGSDSEYCTAIQGQNIIVYCNEGLHNHGSSKVKLSDRIDYNWEFKYQHGHLIAAHIGGKVIAYGMKGKDGGMVRVTNQETNNRALIKNLKEDIKDISFAFSRTEVLLGCVDSEGNVLIYEIKDTPHSISYELLLHVFHVEPVTTSKVNYRLIWCPYLPPAYEDDEVEHNDEEKMFVVLNSTRAEIYNLPMITNKYGKGGPLDPDSSYEGYIEINHTAAVVDASFSSDGTAIAIACSDGFVKFFQLYMNDTEQKCLHEWQPHEGQPLSSIIFIDNILEYSSECWKFTVTGANHNSEIKLWSCETWTCLQKITFKPNPKSIVPNLYLNVALDYAGQYLVISDANNRELFVLQLKRNDEEQVVCVTHFAQFLLPAPFLSFHILEAVSKNIPISLSNSNDDLYDNDEDFDDETEEITAVCLKMLVIQPKKFQECNITFQPERLTCKGLTISETLTIKGEETEKIPELDDLKSSVTLLIQQQQQQQQPQAESNLMTLMTPDDFNVKKESRSDSNPSLDKPEQKIDDAVEVGNLIDFQRPQKDNFASAGSSPSREVQEILSINNSAQNYPTDEYFNNLADLSEEQEKPQKEFTNPEDSIIFQVQEAVNNADLRWPMVPAAKANEVSEIQTTQLQTINFRLTSLENTVRDQNLLIQQLLEELKSSNKNKASEAQDFSKELECAMSKLHLQIAKLLENLARDLVSMQKTKERDMQESLVTATSQVITKSLADKMQQILQNEIKHGIIPIIHNLLESYRHQLDVQYSQKFTNIDVMIRDNFTKVMSSKTLTESISASVVNLVAPSLEKCYRDIVSSSLIPSWERICGQMFQQINDTFTRGTKEYTASVESYMDRQRRVQDKGKDLITQMQTVSENLRGNTERLNATLNSEIEKHFTKAFRSLHDRISENIKDIVAEQVRLGFKSHATVIEDSVINAVRSRAVTPSPHVDPQIATVNNIVYNIDRKHYDEAFQVALCAENLKYVIFTCEKVDADEVFGEECRLHQSSLLALIQQLSMDIHQKTELKLKFIKSAFLALSLEDSTFKHYIPKVLKELLKQLNKLLASSPSKIIANEAKILKMAVESSLGKT